MKYKLHPLSFYVCILAAGFASISTIVNAATTIRADIVMTPQVYTFGNIHRRFINLEIGWTVPLDIGVSTSGIYTYDIRYNLRPITEANWSESIPVRNIDQQLNVAPGSKQVISVSLPLLKGRTYYFGVKSADSFNNWSSISNITSAVIPNQSHQ